MKTPTGDVGTGDLDVDFELGQVLADTIQVSARTVFPTVDVVDNRTCAPNTRVLLEASLGAPPYVQVHWRDETPRVGGGTVAEILVRVVDRDCAGTEVSRAVAYGFGAAENMQSFANWPDEGDFRPGIERALENLRSNLTDLFHDVRGAGVEP